MYSTESEKSQAKKRTGPTANMIPNAINNAPINRIASCMLECAVAVRCFDASGARWVLFGGHAFANCDNPNRGFRIKETGCIQ